MLIRPNGDLLHSDYTYQLVMTNITNPNAQTDNQFFTIVTQHNNDVYNPMVISRNTFASPQISVLQVKSCTTF